MTITCNVKPAWRARIPAVVHVDGTARPQTVSRATNPLYWNLIEAYRQRSGIPLVLNTSFNVHEEPIVCFPENAVQALVRGPHRLPRARPVLGRARQGLDLGLVHHVAGDDRRADAPGQFVAEEGRVLALALAAPRA